MLRRGWLSRMQPAFQRRVIEQCQYRVVPAGEQIYNLGDVAGGMFGFVGGGVAVEIAPAERGPYVASLLIPGSWFGEIAALSGQLRRVGMKATRETELLYLPSPAINAILAENTEAWRYFYLVTVGHFDTAVGLSDDLMRRDHQERVVGILLHLAGCRHRTPAEWLAELDVGQEQLANIANVARTTLGAMLRGLQLTGHIDLSYRRIRIKDPDALRSLMNRDPSIARIPSGSVIGDGFSTEIGRRRHKFGSL